MSSLELAKAQIDVDRRSRAHVGGMSSSELSEAPIDVEGRSRAHSTNSSENTGRHMLQCQGGGDAIKSGGEWISLGPVQAE